MSNFSKCQIYCFVVKNNTWIFQFRKCRVHVCKSLRNNNVDWKVEWENCQKVKNVRNKCGAWSVSIFYALVKKENPNNTNVYLQGMSPARTQTCTFHNLYRRTCVTPCVCKCVCAFVQAAGLGLLLTLKAVLAVWSSCAFGHGRTNKRPAFVVNTPCTLPTPQ